MIKNKLNPEKIQIVSDLGKNIESQYDFFFIDYKGWNVNTFNSLRRKMEAEKVFIKVIKNTLLNLKFKEVCEELEPFLVGPTALVWGEWESAQIAKELLGFFKKEKKGRFKVSFVAGAVYDEKESILLASLPNKDILYGQMLALIQQPVRSLYTVMRENSAAMVRVLEAWRKKNEE